MKNSKREIPEHIRNWRNNMPELDVFIAYLSEPARQIERVGAILESEGVNPENIPRYIRIMRKDLGRHIAEGKSLKDFPDFQRRGYARAVWRKHARQTGLWDELNEFRDENHKVVLLKKMYNVLEKCRTDPLEKVNKDEYIKEANKRFGNLMEKQRNTALMAYNRFLDNYQLLHIHPDFNLIIDSFEIKFEDFLQKYENIRREEQDEEECRILAPTQLDVGVETPTN